MADLIFIALAFLAISGAIAMIVYANPMYSALGVLISMLSVAGMFALLNATFLFLVQIIVYAGAIMTLILFILMFLNIKEEDFGTYYKQDEKGNLLIRIYKRVTFDEIDVLGAKQTTSRITYYELSNITVNEKGNFISKDSEYAGVSTFPISTIDMTVQGLYAKLGLENFQQLK